MQTIFEQIYNVNDTQKLNESFDFNNVKSFKLPTPIVEGGSIIFHIIQKTFILRIEYENLDITDYSKMKVSKYISKEKLEYWLSNNKLANVNYSINGQYQKGATVPLKTLLSILKTLIESMEYIMENYDIECFSIVADSSDKKSYFKYVMYSTLLSKYLPNDWEFVEADFNWYNRSNKGFIIYEN